MEFTLDFSKAIAKKRQGPKSSAQTPANLLELLLMRKKKPKKT
jgi:hypothetical protein